MLLISHRGLFNGPDALLENHPDQIQRALDWGYDVEIDLHVKNGKPLLGHWEGKYEVDLDFLNNEKFWVHCKTVEALDWAIDYLPLEPHMFFHQQDDCTLIEETFIWTYPNPKLILTKNSIAVVPELAFGLDNMVQATQRCYGVCSDYVSYWPNDGLR